MKNYHFTELFKFVAARAIGADNGKVDRANEAIYDMTGEYPVLIRKNTRVWLAYTDGGDPEAGVRFYAILFTKGHKIQNIASVGLAYALADIGYSGPLPKGPESETAGYTQPNLLRPVAYCEQGKKDNVRHFASVMTENAVEFEKPELAAKLFAGGERPNDKRGMSRVYADIVSQQVYAVLTEAGISDQTDLSEIKGRRDFGGTIELEFRREANDLYPQPEDYVLNIKVWGGTPSTILYHIRKIEFSCKEERR